MIFENTFDNLNKEQIDLLNTYFDGYDYQFLSSHTYIANYIWRNTHQISWQIIGDYLSASGRWAISIRKRTSNISCPSH